MGKRLVRLPALFLSDQFSEIQGKEVQLIMLSGRAIRVKVLEMQDGKLLVTNLTGKQELVPIVQVAELIISPEAPY